MLTPRDVEARSMEVQTEEASLLLRSKAQMPCFEWLMCYWTVLSKLVFAAIQIIF